MGVALCDGVRRRRVGGVEVTSGAYYSRVGARSWQMPCVEQIARPRLRDLAGARDVTLCLTPRREYSADAMPQTSPTRRQFLELAAALGVSLWSVPGCTPAATPATRDGPPTPADPDGLSLRAPERVGLLVDDELDELFDMFRYIGEAWDSASNLDNREAFASVIALKTERAPSYLTEYREAVAELRRRRARDGRDRAMAALFFERPDPRIHRFVIAELLRLQIAYGGFRAFGAVNARGCPGGPFAGAARLPYRVGEEG